MLARKRNLKLQSRLGLSSQALGMGERASINTQRVMIYNVIGILFCLH